MSADISAAVTAFATCALAVAAIGAFIYAVRTYRAQALQLEIAKDEAKRLRAPVFDGNVILGGGTACIASLRLLSGERLASLQVVLEGTTAAECPLGFHPAGDTVEPTPAENRPDGWKGEVEQPDASWGPLMPGSTAAWRADPRPGVDVMNNVPAVIHGRAECVGAAGERWIVPITFRLDTKVIKAIGPSASVRYFDQISRGG